MKISHIAFSIVVTYSTQLLAREKIGSVTKLVGNLVVLSNPQPTLQPLPVHANESRVIYEKKFWDARALQTDSEIYLGDQLFCRSDCKALLTLSSGDQILLRRDSYLRISPTSTGEAMPDWLQMEFGTARSLMESKSEKKPIFRMHDKIVESKTSDFIIFFDSSQLSVLEGTAKLTTAMGESIEVEPGKTAFVTTNSGIKKRPINIQDHHEIKAMSEGMIDNDPVVARLENLLNRKPSPPRNWNIFGPQLQHYLGLTKNKQAGKRPMYSSIDFLLEFPALYKNFGAGFLFSILQFDKTIFRSIDFEPGRARATSMSGRFFYRDKTIKTNYFLDLNFGGLAKVNNKDRIKSYAIAGFTVGAEKLFYSNTSFHFYANGGYNYRILHSNFDPDIILHSLMVGILIGRPY